MVPVRLLSLCLLSSVMALGGCAQKRTAPATSIVKTNANANVNADPIAEPVVSQQEVKRPRMGDASVYVDGKTVGVIRHVELPEGCKGKIIKLPGGYEQTNYSINDYLTSVGVDTKKVRGLQIYGGKRVVVIDEKEYRRIGAKLQFSFMQRDRGKVRMEWPPEHLNVNTTVDILTNIAAYVDKEPPHLEDRQLVMPDGTKVEDKLPYAAAEQGNGTRVYVDGALVATVKRKKLTNDILVPNESADSHFSFAGYEKQLGLDEKSIRAVDFLAGDDVVNRSADGAHAVTFSVPRHNQGHILVDLPQDKVATISAVQIFVKNTPPNRTIVDPSSAPDAMMGGAGRGGGSGAGGGSGGAGADDDDIHNL